MPRLNEMYGLETTEMNDPIFVIERVRSLTKWLSQEEDPETRQLVGTSVDTLLEHLKQLI